MTRKIDIAAILPIVSTLSAALCRALPARERQKPATRRGSPSSASTSACRPAPGRPAPLAHPFRRFVYVVGGEVVLVTDDGEEVPRPATPPASRRTTATATSSRTAADGTPSSSSRHAG